eukprot:gene30143-35122_t
MDTMTNCNPMTSTFNGEQCECSPGYPDCPPEDMSDYLIWHFRLNFTASQGPEGMRLFSADDCVAVLSSLEKFSSTVTGLYHHACAESSSDVAPFGYLDVTLYFLYPEGISALTNELKSQDYWQALFEDLNVGCSAFASYTEYRSDCIAAEQPADSCPAATTSHGGAAGAFPATSSALPESCEPLRRLRFQLLAPTHRAVDATVTASTFGNDACDEFAVDMQASFAENIPMVEVFRCFSIDQYSMTVMGTTFSPKAASLVTDSFNSPFLPIIIADFYDVESQTLANIIAETPLFLVLGGRVPCGSILSISPIPTTVAHRQMACKATELLPDVVEIDMLCCAK